MHRTETFLSIIIICINYNKRRIDQILRCKHRLSGSPRLRSSLRKFTWDILDILECIIHLHIVLRTDIRDTIADYVLKIFLNILTDNKDHMVETCFDRIVHRVIHNNMILCIHRLQLLNPSTET